MSAILLPPSLQAQSVVLLPPSLAAQKDSLGNEFWVAFPGNTAAGATQLFLYVISTGPAEIDVDYAPAALGVTPFHQDITMTAAGQLIKVIIPSRSVGTTTAAQSADLQTNDTVEDKGIHVTSTSGSSEFAVYGFSNAAQTADSFLGLPVEVLGREYFVASYPAISTNTLSGSQFAIVGTEAGTTVTITPTAAIGARSAGLPFSVTLEPGNTYLGRAAAGVADLTGTLISANKPVAVFSGNRCGHVPIEMDACDLLLEQLPPTEAWGKQFLSVPFAGRLNGDRFRILGSVNGTTVTVNGSLIPILNRGAFYETVLTTSSEIIADQPVLVLQFEHSRNFDGGSSPSSLNDPSMMVLYPYEQFQQTYTISTPTGAGFDHINYVNFVAPNAAVGAVTLDGVPVPAGRWSSIGTSGFKGVQLALTTPGVHSLASPRPFGVFSSGHGTDALGNGTVSTYANPGGMAVAPVASVKTITLTPSGRTKYLGESVCFSANAKDLAGVGVAGVRVDFNTSVTGAVAFPSTDRSGTTQPQFCYTGTTAGAESVTGKVGTVTGSATVTWLPRPLVASVTTHNREYDGSNVASIASCVLVENGTVTGFTGTPAGLTCSAGGPNTFLDKSVANGKTVTANGITFGGPNSTNWVLTNTTATTTAHITLRAVVPVVTVVSRPYNGANAATLTSQGLMPGDILAGETVTLLVAGPTTFSDKNIGIAKTVTAGGLSISGTDSANYVLTTNTTTTTADITKIPAGLTARSSAKLFGTTKTFAGTEFTTIGLLAPDAVTTATFTSAGAAASAAVSAYSIIPSAGVGTGLDNYTFTYVSGLLTVTTATVSVDLPDLPVIVPYDSTPKGSVCTVSGGLPVTVSYVGTGATTYGPSTTAPTQVGSYAVTCTFAGDPGHEGPVTDGGSVTITKIPAGLTARSSAKLFGTTKTFAGTEFTTSGLLGMDAVTTATFTSAGASASAAVAAYSITPSAGVGTGLDNYTFTYVSGLLTVTTATVSVDLPDLPVIVPYDGTPKGSVCTVSGGLPVTVSYVGTGATTYGPSTTAPTQAGSYAVTCTFAGDPGHEGPVTDGGSVTITKIPASLTARSSAKVFGTTKTFAGTEFTTSGLLGTDAVTTATFTSAGASASATVAAYSITPSAGVGTGLGNYTFTYVSGLLTVTSSVRIGPTPVNLGAAGRFAILSKSGITNVYASTIVGDVGTSPITGAALLLTCGEVTGTIYTVAAPGPAPCRVTDAPYLTTSVLDMEAAYVDVAGRPFPNFIELGAGEIGGRTLAPGIYKWSTGLLISTDVRLSGGPNDVWIFQVAGTMNQANSTHVTLTGGAQAKNIFWQVAGAVTLGTYAHFEGIILAQTMIAVNTGASVNGALYAQTAVTLQMNTVTLPGTPLPPLPVSGAGPAPVNLGTAGTFAILSKSGITNVSASAIVGNVGTSPITGAALLLTCGEVSGTIYTVAAAGPLPCRVTDAPLLTTAVLNMGAAYVDAAGRPFPNFTELGAGAIGGRTLAPGLYKWSSGVSIATDLTLSGGPNDVWIFQVAGTLNQAPATRVTLTGGAQAKNIFWQVAEAVTLGTSARFEGVILAKTMIAVNTGASVNGRLLAQTAVTLQMNTVTQPPQ